MSAYKWLESPIGELLITASDDALSGLYIKGQKYFPVVRADWQERPSLKLFTQTKTQLDEYFAGSRRSFDLPLGPQGTDFQQRVWLHLRQIPFGETTSYGAIARAIGKPGAAQAIGAANGRNPISIIVPCHRVVGASGKMTGYAGGIDRKQWLLWHEQRLNMDDASRETLFRPTESFQRSLALFE